MKLPRLATSGLLLLLTFCALPFAVAQTPRTNDVKRNPLWRVEGRSNVVHLLGSVHLLNRSHYPLAPVIESAFTNSRVVVFEADIAEMEKPETQFGMMSKAMLPEGETLETQLSPQVYKSFMKHLEDNGVPGMMFEQMKPPIAAMTLVVLELVKAGADPAYGIDKHFFARAQRDGKRIVPLETVEFQISLLTDATKAEGELLMKATLKDIDQIRKSFDEIVTAWRNGDAAAIEKLLVEATREAPTLYKKMLVDRNHRWLPKIEEQLRGRENVIVIVGAGHLVGNEGVVELLRAKGFKVTQL